ncbi:hypothetical protein ACIPJN_29020 [Streptomyces sp. NPDC086796]|uniref:hypothetical protein n=1 Tax=Streptomyces sp. NPDC086796 TaxID=3365760 RepID=UPI0038149AB2
MTRPDPQDPLNELAVLVNAAAASSRSMVLLVGPPLSGVTRSMYETAMSQLPDTPLVQLTAGELAEAHAQEDLDAHFGNSLCLQWLDDLSPADLVLLGHGALAGVLPRAVVLASMKTAWCDRLLEHKSAVTAPARTLLMEYADRVTVPFAMTSRERSWLRGQGYPVSKGIAESLVGGEVLVRHYRKAARSNPLGQLLVQAVVDARRCGIHRPFSEDELLALWRACGEDTGGFQRALDWASTPPEGASTGLLFPAGGDRSRGWRPLSYAAGADDGDHDHKPRPLTNHRWQEVADALPNEGDQYALGIAAHLYGQQATAAVALRQAAGGTGAVPQAALRALDHIEAQDR